MRIAFLYGGNIELDSRPQKEIVSLLKAGNKITFLGWNKNKNGPNSQRKCTFFKTTFLVTEICIKSTLGGGFKNNIVSLIKFNLKEFIWLVKNRNTYDVIHACNLNTGFVAEKIARIFKKSLVYDIYDYFVDSHNFTGKVKEYKKSIEKAEQKLINNANATIICSEKRKQQISGCVPKQLAVIYNSPLNQHIFTNSDYKINANTKIKIAYVGCLVKERPIRQLVDLIAEHKDWEFYCGGYGPEEHYVQMMSIKYKNIKYFGKMSYDDAIFLESQCDILPALYDPNIPNHRYAAPNKFFEALMLGKPLIMIKNTGMDELVEKYDIGVVCNYNEQDLEKSILELISRKNEWEDISNKMKKLFFEKYSWEIMQDRLIELYNII